MCISSLYILYIDAYITYYTLTRRVVKFNEVVKLHSLYRVVLYCRVGR